MNKRVVFKINKKPYPTIFELGTLIKLTGVIMEYTDNHIYIFIRMGYEDQLIETVSNYLDKKNVEHKHHFLKDGGLSE